MEVGAPKQEEVGGLGTDCGSLLRKTFLSLLPLAIVVVMPLANLLSPFLSFLEPDKVRTRTVVGRKGDKTVLELDGGGYLIVWDQLS